MLLEIHDLVVERKGTPVLQIDDLSVERGEVLAVVGPNGAGKSTLLLTLARLLKIQRGVIRFNGIELELIPETAYRRRIALVLQEPLLFDATVLENAGIGLRFRGERKEIIEQRVTHWLERLGLMHLASRSARKLSGGESQRVSLARAFVLQPELLLLDEPFSALDARSRQALLDELKAVLDETNTTAIFITHDLQEAMWLATRMAIILNGKLCQVGETKRIFDHPASVDVADFLGNDLPHQIQ